MSRDLRATAILDARDNTGAAFTSAARRIAALDARMKTFTAGQRALERSAVASAGRQAAAMNRSAGMMGSGAGGVLLGGATTLAGYGLGRMAIGAVNRYADVERAMTRTGITGEATNEEIAAGIEQMRKLAMETAQPFDKMREGMDALTSSGKSFQDSLAMMPAIARTAQASGAGMADTANSSVALLNHLSIKAEELQSAQDIMAKAGKLGQFEAKDMARYFPNITPAASAAGFTGLAGLKQLSAVIQTIRMGTGTSEEAATAIKNILQKMETDETTKKFKKMGVDLRGEMTKARKEGANLFDTFLNLTEKALKGDMSKLPQLFQDLEVLQGMRPLLTKRGKIGEFQSQLNDADGTTATDLDRVLKNKQAEIDRFKVAWDHFTTAVGKRLAGSASGKAVTDMLDTSAKSLETPRSDAEIKKGRDDLRDTVMLGRALKDEAAAGKSIVDLAQKLKSDPGYATGYGRVAARAKREQSASALLDARRRGTDLANKLIPKAKGADGFYDTLPVGVKDVVNARDLMRPRSNAAPPRIPEHMVPLGQAPNLFKDVPPLDFDAAVNSAKQGRLDIEAALKEIDLATSGQQAGSSFRTGLVNELKQAETESIGIIGRIKASLNFTATPKVTVGGLNQGVSRAGNEGIPTGVP